MCESCVHQCTTLQRIKTERERVVPHQPGSKFSTAYGVELFQPPGKLDQEIKNVPSFYALFLKPHYLYVYFILHCSYYGSSSFYT